MLKGTVIKPTHKLVRQYHETLEAYNRQGVQHELALRSAFQNLLTDSARLHGWTLIPELSAKVGGQTVRPDATLRDAHTLPRGYWEAKDLHDDLETEIRRKIARGYPLTNTIFEDTQRGVLYQDKRRVLEVELHDPRQVANLLNIFYGHRQENIRDFEQAVDEFKESVPELARGLADKIRDSHRANPDFQAAFDNFFALCRLALNPNLSPDAVDEMLIQHLLTSRLISSVFDNPDFIHRNAIAREVERVMDALFSRSFSRRDYLKGLDRFYKTIEATARSLPDFSD